MDTFIVIMLILSFILNIVLIYRVIVMIGLIEQYQSEVIENEMSYYRLLKKLLTDMRTIDSTGAFETDDEVGSVFSELKLRIEQYYNNEVDAKEEE